MNRLSPYKIGANRGAVLGIIMSVMFLASVYAEKIPLLSFLSLILFFSVPFFVYRSLRKTFVTNSGLPTLSILWMQGIVTFACGSLILALVASIYMRYIEPDFIISMVHKAIDFYSALPDQQSQQVAKLLNQMINAHAVPSAVYLALEMVWLGIFSGSLLSLLLSLLVRARPVPPPHFNN